MSYFSSILPLRSPEDDEHPNQGTNVEVTDAV